MFIDVHCHLDLLKDQDNIIKNSKSARVNLILANGESLEANRKVLEMAEKYNEVKAAIGLYPDEALKMSDEEIDEEIEFIKANKLKIISIGEVGMDFKNPEKHDQQKINFSKFIKLAIELDMPITVHSRKAEKECVELLEELGAKKVIMHYFSGSIKLVERIVKNGWYLSIPTAVNYNEQFQNVVSKVNISHLLCETDSPFSHPGRAGENSPANVIASYEKISEIKGLSLDEVEKQIEANFNELFSFSS